MNSDDFKHRIGDHSAQEGADYLKFNQLGTQQRMAVMRGFEAYRIKKAEEGEKNVHTKDLQPSSWATWLCRRVETQTGTQRGEELSSGPQQVIQLDVENADRYRRWKKKGGGGRGTKDRGRNNVRDYSGDAVAHESGKKATDRKKKSLKERRKTVE